MLWILLGMRAKIVLPILISILILGIVGTSDAFAITTTDTMYSCEVNGDIQKRNKSDGTLISGNAPVISGFPSSFSL